MILIANTHRKRPHTRLLLNLVCFAGMSIAIASCGSSSDSGDADSGTTDGANNGGTGGDGGSAGDNNSDPASIVTAAEFGDDFSIDSLSNWTLRHQAEGEAAQYSVLDINQANPGMLTIVPTLTPGWFANGKAPLIYKRVTGDFSAEASVITQSATNAALPPGSDFNSAGLMARVTGDTGENHIMVNVGRQDSSIADSLGSEAKNTTDSSSVLNLLAGSSNGRLTLCRIGDEFRAYRLLDNETEWTEIGVITRVGFPQTVQVGMVVNGFSGPDILALFDYVRMRVPTSAADCTVN